MKKYFKKLFLLIFVLLTALILFDKKYTKAIVTKSVDIYACNLSFMESAKIMYAVDSQNIEDKNNIKVLIWTSPQETYEIGCEDYILSVLRMENIEGKDYAIFINSNVGAKQMTDNYYAVPYYNDNGADIYGDVVKYSVIQYAKNISGTNKSNKNLDRMINEMLEYGASAQLYFGYNIDRLANETYFDVKLEGASLDDNFSYGLFKENDIINFTTDQIDFKSWVDDEGYIISENSNATYIVKKDIIIHLDTEIQSSQGLSFSLINDDKEYEVGVGTCVDSNIIIPATFNGKPVTKIEDYAFKDKDIESIIFGINIKEVGYAAFECCYSLATIKMGYNLERIGDWAFTQCSGLVSINMPKSLLYIGDSAFWNCTNLASINFSEGLIEIGDYAFSMCSTLIDMIIPRSVVKIGSDIFNICSSLQKVVLPDSIIKITEDTFFKCGALAKIYYYGTSLVWNNIVIKDLDITKLNLENIEFYEYSESVPVKEGKYWRFEDGKIQEYNISSGLKYADYQSGCKIAGIGSCTDEIIVVPEKHEGKVVKAVGNSAFADCVDLHKITFNSNIETIESEAFSSCLILECIIIPKSVTYIGEQAFDCCNYLTYIYYCGSPLEWAAITKESNNEGLFSKTICYYSETRQVDDGNKYWHYEDGKPKLWR